MDSVFNHLDNVLESWDNMYQCRDSQFAAIMEMAGGCGMRRLEKAQFEVWKQIDQAARGIALEPGWPSTPTHAEVQALAAKLDTDIQAIGSAKLALGLLRAQLATDYKASLVMLRRIDAITDSLYGRSGGKKLQYGLRPIDEIKNSAGPVPQVSGLSLADGLGPGSLVAKWTSVKRAAYDIQWFSSASLEQLIGSAASTRATVEILGLAPGTQIWLRVRALRAGKLGDWSEVATRIANV
jgi:hypothetical protein